MVRTRKSAAHRPSRYRPHLLALEARLPLGDGVLGLLVGTALLPPHAAPAAVPPAPQPTGAPVVGRVSNPSTWLDGLETRPTAPAFAGAPSAAPAALDWVPLTDPFAATARRRPETLFPSPQRQQGPDAAPLLALRAPEEHAASPFRSATPALLAATPHSDSVLLLTLAALHQPEASARPAEATPAQEAQVKASFGRLPLSFEANVGQADAKVDFLTRGPGYALYLSAAEATMVLQPPGDEAAGRAGGVNPLVQGASVDWPRDRGVDTPRSPEEPPAIVRMQVLGGNPAASASGVDRLPGVVNYFLGNDPSQWHTGIATYGRVAYDDVYPGIDLVWYGSQSQLEYDFVVSPGADPSAIRLGFWGAERVEIDAGGDLVLHAGGQELRQHAPFVYQEVSGQQQEVASRFVLEGQQVRFAMGAFDAGRPLVIDPVLSYSTFLGGSGLDWGFGLAVDPASGDVLVTGNTQSTNFPTANPLQATHGGGFDDVFLTRLNAAGTALVYSTYLGGNNPDFGYAIAVDPAGGVLVTGETHSTNFPTANPLQATNRGGADVFVTRLNAAGSALIYSTYLGGSNWDIAYALAVDPASGHALVTGRTASNNFPTANPLQAANRGSADVFVTRLNATGSALVYSTYLGGSNYDSAGDLAVDPNGDVLLTGGTFSTDFPTLNPLQASNRGSWDGFVTRLSATGSALVYSTYLGGSDQDGFGSLTVDRASGDVLITGQTASTNFPTANPLQAAHAGGYYDAFVTRLNRAGSALIYSTYLGGNDHDTGLALTVDGASGDVLIAGITNSTNFPTANPLQPTLRGSYDAFVTRLNRAGSALVFSTYLGGSGEDTGNHLALDAAGNTYLIGYTQSPNFPTAHAFQPTYGGFFDVFVAKISTVTVPPTIDCSVGRSLLWPPNHRLVDVGLDVVVIPGEDPNPTLRIQVYGNDGADPSDAAGIGPVGLRLRAERQGGGSGRVYLIVATATDASGNAGFDVCAVVVPHDRSPASVARVVAQAAAAEAYYREFGEVPPGYALLGEGP